MFLVPTYLAPSDIHGVGVFTSRPIPAGTRIWEFTPQVDWRIPPDELERFPEPYRAQLLRWSYQEESGFYILCGDNAKFMNHSPRPNCEDREGPYTLAKRDIEAGEELTCDYRTFDVQSRENGLEFQTEEEKGETLEPMRA